MTKEEALAVLEQVTGASALTRQQHMTVLQALTTLRGTPFNPISKEEIEKAKAKAKEAK